MLKNILQVGEGELAYDAFFLKLQKVIVFFVFQILTQP